MGKKKGPEPTQAKVKNTNAPAKPKKKKSTQPAQVKQKKKVWASKQVLASPFAPFMPSASPATWQQALQVLLIAIPRPFAKRPPRPSRTANPLPENRPLPHHTCKKPEDLLCGLNEVTRALERNSVEIAVVSRDVTPALLVAHIPVLCFMANAPLVVLPGDGTDVGEMFGTRRMLTFAVRKSKDGKIRDPSSAAEKLVQGLKNLATPLDYPWLAAAVKGGDVPELPTPLMIPHRSRMDIG